MKSNDNDGLAAAAGMIPMTDENLKPCPFCTGGSGAHLTSHKWKDGKVEWWVYCGNCGNRSASHTFSESKAIQLWNTRAQEPTDDAVEALKKPWPLNAGRGDGDHYSEGWNDCLDEIVKRGFLQTPAAGNAIPSGNANFQDRVNPWMQACFGPEISADRIERNHRFLEEALELVQANGCTQSEAHQLVDYVFNRPTGELYQEVGGVMVTLAALCLASGQNMHDCGEKELARIWTKVEKIRAKQAAKPKHSPLPEAAPSTNKEETK